MNIAIFGSCVSRDTCEFMPHANVVTYVARQSVTSLASPHGEASVDLSALESSFQRRMVLSDLSGSGVERIVSNDEPVDLVLIDLVDERRGFWLFPDGTSMTNSLEIESCGAADEAKTQGARLVEFGMDEHFAAWRQGFELLIGGLRNAAILDRSILLDVEWARAIDEAPHPQDNFVSQIGRNWRRTQRGVRDAYRQLAAGRGIWRALDQIRQVAPTDAEEFSNRASFANSAFQRYREVARAYVPTVISRSSDQVRINSLHKWGPQPFHYRDSDYASIVASISKELSRIPRGGTSE